MSSDAEPPMHTGGSELRSCVMHAQQLVQDGLTKLGQEAGILGLLALQLLDLHHACSVLESRQR